MGCQEHSLYREITVEKVRKKISHGVLTDFARGFLSMGEGSQGTLQGVNRRRTEYFFNKYLQFRGTSFANTQFFAVGVSKLSRKNWIFIFEDSN